MIYIMKSKEINIPRYKTKFSLKNKSKRAIWAIIRFFFFRYTPSFLPIFNQWRILILKIFGAQIGKYTIIYPSAKIWAPWNLIIGKNCCIGPNVFCYNPSLLKLGNKVVISQNTYICGGSHDINSISLPFKCLPIKINDYVWICADSFIMMGINIGEGAVIGERSVVVKDIQPYNVVAGNPAKFVKKRIINEQL